MPTNLRSIEPSPPMNRPIHTPVVDWRRGARLLRSALLIVGLAAVVGLCGLVMESAGDAYARALVGSYTHLSFSMPR